MAATASPYWALIDHLAQKRIDVDSDPLKVALLGSGYTPNLDTHDFFNDLTSELSTVSTTLAAAAAAGATTISTVASVPVGTTILIGGSEARTVTAVSGSGPYTLTVAALSAAQSSGASVVANSGYTAGGLALGSVAWAYNSATKTWSLDAADAVWSNATIGGARYAVIYDDGPSTAATKPLIALIDFGEAISSTAAPFTIAWNAGGIVVIGKPAA